jgi:hypothetical protein
VVGGMVAEQFFGSRAAPLVAAAHEQQVFFHA